MIWKPALIFSSPFKAALTTQFPLNIIWRFNTRYKTQWGRDRYCAGFNYLNDSLQQLLCVYFTLHLKECSLISWNPPPLIFSWHPAIMYSWFLEIVPSHFITPPSKKKKKIAIMIIMLSLRLTSLYHIVSAPGRMEGACNTECKFCCCSF